jgi:hypothetical protein
VTINSSSAATSELTIATTTATSSRRPNGLWKHRGDVLVAILLLGLAPFRRRKLVIMLALLCILTAGAVLGCGGGGGGSTSGGGLPPPNYGTTIGRYSITVTATSGTVSASAAIPFTVQ